MTSDILDAKAVWNRSVIVAYIVASSATVVGLAMAVYSGVV